jgi:hypothetical protein
MVRGLSGGPSSIALISAVMLFAKSAALTTVNAASHTYSRTGNTTVPSTKSGELRSLMERPGSS